MTRNRQIIYLNNYEEMSRAAAEHIFQVISEKPSAAIVVATGHSPLLTYQILVKKVLESSLDISRVTWIKLDEWLGITKEDEASCELFIQRELIEPLHIDEKRYIHFNPEAENPELEAARIAQIVRQMSGFTLAVLGIGMNGHLGLNEPAEELQAYAHTMELDSKTKTHEMLTHTSQPVLRGITLGIEDLFRSDRILLLADGEEKEKGLDYFMNDRITTLMPVSLLKLHPDCICMVNQECFDLKQTCC